MNSLSDIHLRTKPEVEYLFLNYLNDKTCILSKQNIVKTDLEDKESIVIYCNKDRCKVSY